MSSAFELLWHTHLKGEFETKDVEATLATMASKVNMNARRHRPPPRGPHPRDITFHTVVGEAAAPTGAAYGGPQVNRRRRRSQPPLPA